MQRLTLDIVDIATYADKVRAEIRTTEDKVCFF